MGFQEWVGESYDPGPRGTVEMGFGHASPQWTWLIVARFVFSVVLLAVVWGLSAPQIPLPALQSWGLVIGGTLIYLGLGYIVRPEPRTDNLGWSGTLFDHPGRWSDDYNRTLIAWTVMLGPGRFITESLLDGLSLLRPSHESTEDESQDAGSEPCATSCTD